MMLSFELDRDLEGKKWLFQISTGKKGQILRCFTRRFAWPYHFFKWGFHGFGAGPFGFMYWPPKKVEASKPIPVTVEYEEHA